MTHRSCDCLTFFLFPSVCLEKKGMLVAIGKLWVFCRPVFLDYHDDKVLFLAYRFASFICLPSQDVVNFKFTSLCQMVMLKSLIYGPNNMFVIRGETHKLMKILFSVWARQFKLSQDGINATSNGLLNSDLIRNARIYNSCWK